MKSVLFVLCSQVPAAAVVDETFSQAPIPLNYQNLETPTQINLAPLTIPILTVSPSLDELEQSAKTFKDRRIRLGKLFFKKLYKLSKEVEMGKVERVTSLYLIFESL